MTIAILVIFAGLLTMGAGFFLGKQKVKKAFKNVLRLNDISTEIASSAEQIASVSQEIDASSKEQLDTLNTTVAASYEIRSMVEKTTDNANNLLNEADELKKSVSLGTQVISKMVASSGDMKTSMDNFQKEMHQSIEELNQALKVIQNIAVKTQVINEIVFQTKILSFNASVEAARAGEAGKGFSVVAEEIGKLAQMSGNAANEISDIVTQSLATAGKAVHSTAEKIDFLAKDTIAKAELSFNDANECEEIFNLMETKISATVEMLTSITSATSEQAQGVVQLNQSLTKFQEAADRNRLIASQSTQHSQTFEKLTTALSEISSDWLIQAGHNPETTKNYKKFIWSDRLELGVHKMDEEHKTLVHKINALVDSLEKNHHHKDLASVKQNFKALAAYTVEHFQDEEAYMESIQYPQLDSHKRIHKKLLEQVGKFGKDLENGKLDDTKLISFLSNWLISHIMGVDMQYAKNQLHKSGEKKRAA